MRIQQKQINHLLLLSFVLFILLPHPTFAADGGIGKGKLHIKTDRIILENNEQERFGETELDRVLPGLFTDEVQNQLHEQQTVDEHNATKLKEALFAEEIPEKTTLYDVKSTLFSDEYVSSFSHTKVPPEVEQPTSIATILFYGGLVIGIGIIFGGVVVLLRNF
jgi:type VII secretion protein EssA